MNLDSFFAGAILLFTLAVFGVPIFLFILFVSETMKFINDIGGKDDD